MSAKVSISLPEDLFRQFEAKRRERHLPRSAAVQRALKLWTAEPSERAAGWDLDFIEAYQRQPQDGHDLAAWVEAGLETWAPPSGPKRRRRT
jgi:hypothetical protein